MKYFFIVVFTAFYIYSCGGSGKVTVDELLHNPSFDSNHFFNSKISIYSPYIVNYANQKYPNITKADLTNVVLNKVKEKISINSNNPNIKIENQTAPDYFRGIKLRSGEGEQLLKNSNSDYLLIIQSVTIGNEIKKRSNTEITDPFPSELKNKLRKLKQ